jgi:hyaluronoglucosaminidase
LYKIGTFPHVAAYYLNYFVLNDCLLILLLRNSLLMTDSTEFLVGVIEGFYGRAWSFQTRLDYADYLAEAGLNTYLYCPKGDLFLRARWQENWPTARWQELLQLSSAYTQRGINWGVGLSPVELYRNYGASERQALKHKTERLSELNAPILAILFDDMPGNLDALAIRQAEIVADIRHWMPGVQLLVCPTYYSLDPVLEQFFGQMPKDYWPQLGRELPPDTMVFWTGNRVCSESIHVCDVEVIVEQLGRPVILWDNYPVNDGAQRSKFLYTSKLSQRPSELRPYISGHLCNPMNQGLLSLPALSGLVDLYGSGRLDDSSLSRILGPATWKSLSRDKSLFENQGLDGIGIQGCQKLAAEYAKLPGAAAAEVTQWLLGQYSFDPACLTA